MSILTLTLVGTSLFAVPQAYAQTPGTQVHMGLFQGLFQFLGQKFGLDKTQVQSAIGEYQQGRKANGTPRPTLTQEQFTDKQKSRLDQLVADGKITTGQETAIINELAAIKSKYNPESWKDLTPQERKTKMNAMRDEIISWATSQGIDSSYVMPVFGMGGAGMHGRGMGGWGMIGNK